ncbi:MAG: choice-of-anchor X domain-containing protein [Hyphomicrobiales bacterium]
MIRQHASTLIVSVLGILAVGGCSTQNPARPPIDAAAQQTAADKTAIQDLVATSPEFDVAFTDDDGQLLGEASTATPTSATAPGTQVSATDSTVGATSPVWWGRRRIPPDQPPTRTVEFLTPPDSGRALVKVTVQFNGWLYVDRTDDGIRNPGKKPLKDQVTRYALFRKIWFHPDSTSTDSVFGWRLLAVSPSQFTMIDPSRQTVNITSVTITGANRTITITDPSALLKLRPGTDPSVPLFRSGEILKVEAAVTNTDDGFDPPEFVTLHVPIDARAFPGPRDRVRIRMWDNGQNGDAVAGDGVYTAMWTVRDLGIHHAAVDVINARTLQNETDDDYNSTAWGLPYVSYPSFLP